MADVESLKTESAYLLGDLAEQLADAGDAFTPDATQLLKFHGSYQQDDRDVRKERAKQGLPRATTMMVRASIPGGVLTAEQYLAADALADEVSNGTLRITTRQGLQWHLIGKHDLKQLIRTLNDHLVTTLAACGDVARNVCACPAPLPGRDDLLPHAERLAVAVRPRSSAYWDLWLDGERAVSAVPPADDPEATARLGGDAVEPLYGPTYLPRKFKIGFAHEGDNCVDVYTNDVGLVPTRDAAGTIDGFVVLVGGGLGMTHNKPATYPRLADPLATITPDELVEVVETIITVQRDHGDRSDRKHARMKYLIEDRGLDWFRGEVEARLGRELDAPRPLTWDDTHDHLGWHRQDLDDVAEAAAAEARWFLGVPVPSGRIQDLPGRTLRSAVRDLVRDLGLGVRFSARQDLLLTDVPASRREEVTRRLRDAGVPLVEDVPAVTRHALACPALPTCGLALTEAERALPEVTDRLAKSLEEIGVGQEPVHLRVTGCPNGCARPYSTEIGVVGRGKDHYTVHLGGDAVGTRLNEIVADRVHLDDLVPTLAPVFTAWRDDRADGETFGDWCERAGAEQLRDLLGQAPS
ncbi:NADPH-dependent assimilatory sulfite reductase hemoprotein subunit [Nitriliruptoraceae bacterium ZYF776]|nr:NADPH-dependent assimilatory sulfite reductase hemoprotein subunit [Profundirhabdus halotolerans]